MLLVIVFRQQRLAAIQGLPRPLNAAASMHAGVAATLIDVDFTLTPFKPWNEETAFLMYMIDITHYML